MHVYHIKRTAPVVKANLDQYATEFHDNGTSILALARQANYPPYLFARFMVEHLTTLKKTDISAAVMNPMLYLSDPSILLQQQQLEPSQQKTITNSDTTTARRLARDIHEAVTSDPLCGPRHDVARRMVGVEFEVVLEHKLSALGIPFETEANLRARGTSRTPDVLLSTPVAIPTITKHNNQPNNNDDNNTDKWKIINWIDSKALFGDVDTHRQSVLSQAESYLHRFGPGLIVYWFGHAPLALLDDLAGEVVITGWQLPDQFLLPNGRIICAPK